MEPLPDPSLHLRLGGEWKPGVGRLHAVIARVIRVGDRLVRLAHPHPLRRLNPLRTLHIDDFAHQWSWLLRHVLALLSSMRRLLVSPRLQGSCWPPARLWILPPTDCILLLAAQDGVRLAVNVSARQLREGLGASSLLD
jgi:hypothetical protein